MNGQQTAAAAEFPTTYEVIAKMRVTGGWFLRKRRRTLPALWCWTARRTLAPATPARVSGWLRETYPCFKSDDPYTRLLAEAVIAELRYNEYGLPVLTDDSVGLV